MKNREFNVPDIDTVDLPEAVKILADFLEFSLEQNKEVGIQTLSLYAELVEQLVDILRDIGNCIKNAISLLNGN